MPSPLDGISVLDFTRFQAGPTATVMLSDLGARVIKVEIPGQGDQGRYIYPVEGVDTTPYFIAHDRGKEGITVDYRRPEGLEVLQRLVGRCDVLVENFRPGYAERYGLGYEQLKAHNPKLIYGSASAYGEAGPLAGFAGFDIHGQAMGGIMSVTGTEDAAYPAGAAIGDQLAGMMLASAVLGGLLARERQGIGQKVGVSLYGCQLALQSWEIDQCSIGGAAPGKAHNSHPQLRRTGMVWGSFPTKQGEIALGGLGGERWLLFCKLLEIDPGPQADASASFTQDKSRHMEAIRARLLQRTADEWVALFREHDLMIAKVQTYPEILADPQARANGYITDLEDGAGRTHRVVGSPYRFSDTPPRQQGPPPELGQHTEMVLEECGYNWDRIAELREQGII